MQRQPTQIERVLCRQRMAMWFSESERWADQFDASLPTTEEMIALSNDGVLPPGNENLMTCAIYFIFTAGSVYYHALELAKMQWGEASAINWIKVERQNHPALQAMFERRTLLNHGAVNIRPDLEFVFQTIVGPDKTPQEVFAEAERTGRGSAGIGYKALWVDRQTGTEDIVAEWNRTVLSDLAALMAQV